MYVMSQIDRLNAWSWRNPTHPSGANPSAMPPISTIGTLMAQLCELYTVALVDLKRRPLSVASRSKRLRSDTVGVPAMVCGHALGSAFQAGLAVGAVLVVMPCRKSPFRKNELPD